MSQIQISPDSQFDDLVQQKISHLLKSHQNQLSCVFICSQLEKLFTSSDGSIDQLSFFSMFYPDVKEYSLSSEC